MCENKSVQILTIPGKMKCPNGWTKEYSGFLMADYYDHPSNKGTWLTLLERNS